MKVPSHSIAFSSKKLSTTERDYTTVEREELDMVYDLQNFRNYFLGGEFKMFTNHSALKYMVNNPMLGVSIY